MASSVQASKDRFRRAAFMVVGARGGGASAAMSATCTWHAWAVHRATRAVRQPQTGWPARFRLARAVGRLTSMLSPNGLFEGAPKVAESPTVKFDRLAVRLYNWTLIVGTELGSDINN